MAPSTRLRLLTGTGGTVPLVNMSTGEVIFGGVGSGLYGMLLFVILAVFIAGLMVGRTPEYLGKKIEAREVKLVMVGTLFVPLAVLSPPRWRSRPSTARPRSTTPGRRGSRRRSTPTSRRPTTTARRSRATRATSSPTRPATSAPSASPSPTCWAAWPCSSGALSRWSPRLRLPELWRPSGCPPRPRHVSHRHRHLRGPRDATIVIVAALTFFPAFLLGPVVQGLTDQLF